MTVKIERSGPVTTILLARPEVRNAVDGPTAQALADAFRAFEADRCIHSRRFVATVERDHT